MGRISQLPIGPPSRPFKVDELASTSFSPNQVGGALPRDLDSNTLDRISGRCSLEHIQGAVSRHAANERAAQLHRRRWFQWSEGKDGPLKRQRAIRDQAKRSNTVVDGASVSPLPTDDADEDGISVPHPVDEATRQFEKLEKNLPEPFSYFREPSVGTAFCTRLSKTEVSAIGRPGPSKDIRTKRRRFDHMDRDDEANDDGEACKTRNQQEGTAATEDGDDEVNRKEEDAIAVLGISIFARPLRAYPSRSYHNRVAAKSSFVDQCLYRLKLPVGADEDDESEDNDFEQPSPEVSLRDEADHNDGQGKEDGDNEGVSPRRGKEKGNNYLYEEEAELVQKLEIRSDMTLLQLRDALYCRLDDMPEVHEPRGRLETVVDLHRSVLAGADALSAARREAEERDRSPLFSGRKRRTDSVFLIEGQLYSEGRIHKDDDVDGWNQSYASLLASHMEKESSGKTPSAVDSCKLMGDIKLSELVICAGKPYWYLHQGSCEHFWAITSVRALHPRDEPKTQGGHAPDTWEFPITAHLPLGWTKRPAVRWSHPGKGYSESYTLEVCSVCARRPSALLISGGSRVQVSQPRHTGDGGRGSLLGGLPHDVVPWCETCWERLIGNTPPTTDDVVGRCQDGEALSDQSNRSWAKAGGHHWTVVPNLD